MKFVVEKITLLFFTLFLISFLTFFSFTFIPGDASVVKLGTDASPERLEQVREEMGLNDPLMIRYTNWVKGIFRGDFGESYQYTGTNVGTLLSERFVVTALLSVMSFLIIIIISIPLGSFTAKHSGTLPDSIIMTVSRITMAIPPFFLGIILTYIFAFVFKVFQPGKFISPQDNFLSSVCYLFLPAFAIAIPRIGMVVRFLRASILKEVDKDYVRTAYSKGNSKDRVFYKHILRNALIPVVTVLAIIAAEILAGSIVIEQVFSVPGVGRLLINAISNRDYPVVQGVIILITGIVVLMNFILDLLYRVIDPRVV